ncbi:P-loop containing nucleoside triphosphate hydrolase protein [Kalaharituber pfeilii]|nr:P-loop containing nucleoside triphosphate hydrolase protein [Kalaharituber pfeilii]
MIPGLKSKAIEDILWYYHYNKESRVINAVATTSLAYTKNDFGQSSKKAPMDSLLEEKTLEILSQHIRALLSKFAISIPDDVVLGAQKYKKTKAKDNANFVVIGHVDAKSTLMGRLLYDLGIEAEQIGKSSFAFAWVLDQTSEERNRGVTIDIATNKFETEDCNFTILDALVHKDFIPNMIAGASQADFAILVVDSSVGEFETGFNHRGQTKEHTLLVSSMGVQRIIVAARFEEIQQQISQFLTVAGFNPKNVSFIPCNDLTGDNITWKPKEGLLPWYGGPTLVEELEKSKPMKRAVDKPFRLTISNVFRGGVTHPVSVAGRIESGYVQIGDVLLDMPIAEKVAVKPQDWALAGRNVVLHLRGIDFERLKLGISCVMSDSVLAVSTFTLKILAFESITPVAVDIHRGRLDAPGKLSRLINTFEKSTGIVLPKKPRYIPPGSLATIQVDVVGGAIPIEPQTRIVLREDGHTVAAGLHLACYHKASPNDVFVKRLKLQGRQGCIVPVAL